MDLKADKARRKALDLAWFAVKLLSNGGIAGKAAKALKPHLKQDSAYVEGHRMLRRLWESSRQKKSKTGLSAYDQT